MLWLLLDVTLGVLALLVLGAAAFTLYRRVRVLLRTLGETGTQVDAALAGIHDAQAPDRESRPTTT